MFAIHTADTAPEGSRAGLAAIHERIGFVPNLAAAIASSPAALAGFGAMQATLRGSTLSPLEREVAGLVVSFENDCGYSVAAHSTLAIGAGISPPALAALRAGQALDEPRPEAVRRFAASLVRDRGHAREAFGLSPEEQLEVAAQVAYTMLANLVANLTDPPLDETFAAQRWDVPATLGASG